MGPGFHAMNVVVVQQTTQGLCRYLQQVAPAQLAQGGVVIGAWVQPLVSMLALALSWSVSARQVVNGLFASHLCSAHYNIFPVLGSTDVNQMQPAAAQLHYKLTQRCETCRI